MSSISSLARASVKALTPYASARRSMSGGSVWLNANENALAPHYQLSGCYNRYPSCQPAELLAAYASFANVSAEQVLVSRGADEGIELLIRSFCEPGVDQIVICPPTYGMYAISAESQGVSRTVVPLKGDLTLDLPAILATPQLKIVFVCSPNNPTGDLIPRSQIVTLLQALKDRALVVVDEAYIEFIASESVIDLLSSYDNLVILRTLSKAFGLAGLRCGFTLANPAVINALKQMIAPYPLAQPVIEIACQALSPAHIDLMWQSVATINRLRDAFIAFAQQLPGIKRVFSSNANYVLLGVDDAQAWVDALSRDGILVRNQSSQAGLERLGCRQVIRVSIGSETEMSALQQQMTQQSARWA